MIRIATDMVFYLGPESDPDNSLVEWAWDVADRSTRNFNITRQCNGALGDGRRRFGSNGIALPLVKVRNGSAAVESGNRGAWYTDINHHLAHNRHPHNSPMQPLCASPPLLTTRQP